MHGWNGTAVTAPSAGRCLRLGYLLCLFVIVVRNRGVCGRASARVSRFADRALWWRGRRAATASYRLCAHSDDHSEYFCCCRWEVVLSPASVLYLPWHACVFGTISASRLKLCNAWLRLHRVATARSRSFASNSFAASLFRCVALPVGCTDLGYHAGVSGAELLAM